MKYKVQKTSVGYRFAKDVPKAETLTNIGQEKFSLLNFHFHYATSFFQQTKHIY